MQENGSSFGMWSDYRSKYEHMMIGLMSGTSLDGVDAALVRIKSDPSGKLTEVSLVDYVCVPYSDELRKEVIALCSTEHARIDKLVCAHFGISEWYAYTVKRLLQSAKLNSSDIDAVCMHGQTVWHAPETKMFPGPESDFAVKSTLQIGEVSVVHERTGIPVIGNFRSRDMAAGGEGAPLTPYLDALLFGSPHEGRVVQNIGGIGNVTVIPAGAERERISAFDTGPGNMVIDAVVRAETNGRQHYDPNGSIAAEGNVNQELIALYMQDPYFSRKPPKSTGREFYGAAFAQRFIEEANRRSLSFSDTVATATALTAESIVRAIEDFVLPDTPVAKLLACGGGSSNMTLMDMIRKRLPQGVSLHRTLEFGIPDNAREAIAFAVLGHESLMGRPSNLPAVTGAGRSAILGTMSL
ncbi:anhydro-N-acetylmuramic acid kinase [Paenibacillus sp. N3.4]|uniref:anhydro-N-acetylmuramic acid kinase n=1 Tax=Paenibacillus sp. N3.4 TaxID=2603222 RepID=UPI0021C2C935|nr:anhydro-N-acetylmuramic acid kinase [Paenibacillus sp. N3.4]